MTKLPTKKVLFTSHTANFSKFNRPFMRWFSEQGYEVHYASMGEEEVLDCDTHFTIPFERSPFKLNNLRAIEQLKKIVDAEGYEIIHTHTPMGGVVTRLASRKARKNGTRVIYTAHGFHFFKGAPLLNWVIYYPIERLMSYLTDVIVTINQEDLSYAKGFFAQETYKIDGVGVNLGRFKPVSSDEQSKLRGEYHYKESDFILLCVGEFTKNKNQKFLVNSLSRLMTEYPSIKLVFAGKGDELNACKALCAKIGLTAQSVRFLGYVKNVDELYQLSDVLVSASYREGLPVNIVEAMASGLPIVCTNIRGCRDLVEGGVNGYTYSVNDAASYIAAINALINDKSLYSTICQDNVRKAEIYSISNARASMKVIYEKTN